MKAAGVAALVGLAVFVAAVLALHVLQPELRPGDVAVSYYVHGPSGGLLTAGLLALGAASVAVVAALWRPAREARFGRALLAVWAAGVLLGGVFRADPPGRWDQPPSLAGAIHGNAAIAAFLALPVGAWLVSRALGRQPEWRASAGLLRALAVSAAVTLALFFASLAPVFVRPGPPVLLGATERLLLAAYVAWLAAASAGLLRQDAHVAGG